MGIVPRSAPCLSPGRAWPVTQYPCGFCGSAHKTQVVAQGQPLIPTKAGIHTTVLRRNLPSRGGTIEVKASYTNIVVRDIGIGIAPDILPHVFDLFTQSQ